MVVGLSGCLGGNRLGFVVVCWVWNWLKMMMVGVWLFLGLVLLMMIVEGGFLGLEFAVSRYMGLISLVV